MARVEVLGNKMWPRADEVIFPGSFFQGPPVKRMLNDVAKGT
jgi:hypothetical protein